MNKDSTSINNSEGAAQTGAGDLEPLDYGSLNVMAERCAECLFSPGALVDSEWRRKLIKGCMESGSFFVCHRATIEGGLVVCCRGFFDSHESAPIQLAKALSLVRFVPVEDLKRLNPSGRRTVSPDIAFLLALHGKQLAED
jgi:hypothetical protein